METEDTVTGQQPKDNEVPEPLTGSGDENCQPKRPGSGCRLGPPSGLHELFEGVIADH